MAVPSFMRPPERPTGNISAVVYALTRGLRVWKCSDIEAGGRIWKDLESDGMEVVF